jgi:hypothetical protein
VKRRGIGALEENQRGEAGDGGVVENREGEEQVKRALAAVH